jgi:hypothetical protein
MTLVLVKAVKRVLDLLNAGETSPTPSALRTISYLLESQALRQHHLARQTSGSEAQLRACHPIGISW